MDNIQTKEQIEDFMHDVIANILPHIEKSNIRPAFQKTKRNNPAGANVISQSGEIDGLRGFTNKDNFIYFRVLENPQSNTESEVEPDDTTSFIEHIELTVYIYGEKAQRNALLLKALMRTTRVQDYLNLNGYYQLDEGDITPLSENNNGEWWDRTDVKFNFTRKVVIEVEPEDEITIAKSYNKGVLPEVIVDGGNRDAKK